MTARQIETLNAVTYNVQTIMAELVRFAMPIVVVGDTNSGQVTIHWDRPLRVAVSTNHIGRVSTVAHKRCNGTRETISMTYHAYYLPLRGKVLIVMINGHALVV